MSDERGDDLRRAWELAEERVGLAAHLVKKASMALNNARMVEEEERRAASKARDEFQVFLHCKAVRESEAT